MELQLIDTQRVHPGPTHRKRRQQIKHRRRQRFRKRLLMVAVILLLFIGGAKMLSAIKPAVNALAGRMTGEVAAPQKLESSEVHRRLKELAGQSAQYEQIYENADKYPENLLAALCNNPEMLEFVQGYLESDGEVTGGLSRREKNSNGIPLLLQWDQRWGYAPYGDNNIGLSGCAPTCLSMVAVGLTGNEQATPDAIADYAMKEGYYVEGTGTAWRLMTDGCRKFGVVGTELVLDKDTVLSKLKNKKPIICSVRSGDFTTTGHFIVLTGVEDGKIKVNDPNSKKRSTKLWQYEKLEGQIRNLWVFDKK